MPKIQNTLALSVIDQDSDFRFVQNGTLVDAENFLVSSTEGSDRGVGKNVLGNVKKSNYNYAGAKVIGKGSCPSKNKIYFAIKATSFDYIMEYDMVAETSAIVLQSTTGGALNFQAGERVLNMDVIVDPEGNGDLLMFSGDSNPPRIINIERSKTFGLDGFTAEEIMQIKPPPLYPMTMVGASSSENVESNNLEDRFVTFAYRYRYKDGYYSCASAWTRYFFEPGPFDLDFNTFENNGMLNIRNAVDLTFNTGEREVSGVDLLFRLSNDNNIYIIEKFVKEDEGWPDNTTQTYQFNNSKVYSVLPESEYYRSFDNVPHRVTAATVAGNRSMLANYVEQYDLVDANGDKVLMDYTLDLVSNSIISENLLYSSANITYNYEAPDPEVEVEDGIGIVVFRDDNNDPLNYVEGAAIFINFNIRAVNDDETRTIEFEALFSYVLDADYANLQDVIDNSGFVDALSVQFQDYFENNGGITLPDDWVATTVLQPFSVLVVEDEYLVIKMPVIKYELTGAEFIYDYFSEFDSAATYQNVAVGTSLKSRRSYEVCMIYRDKQGRKTTALTSRLNTLFIPNENSINQNQIKVTIPPNQLPPAWAHTYKFGIKVNKGPYEQIMASIFFVDGTYRWIKLDGENKNKVKDGDVLIVKKDSGGALAEVIKVKVLELKQQDRDFIEGNQNENGEDIIEPAGLYMKIQPKNFEIAYDEDEFLNFEHNASSNSLKPYVYLGGLEKLVDGSYEPIPIGQGSTIRIKLHNYESGGEDSSFDKIYTVQNNYTSFEDWFNAEVTMPLQTQDRDFDDITFVRGHFNGPYFIQTGSADDNLFMKVHGVYSGRRSEASRFNSALYIRNVDGFFVFETEPDDIDEGVFYETPEVYTITDGQHEMEEHLLTETFNCYAFGNGVESYQIRDAFNEKNLVIDYCPTAISEDEYRQVTRFADITYSGIYNSTTNVNKLNEFNLSLGNFKDDIEKSFGPIMKIKGIDTNLEVLQQDKESLVYYGKDLLYNADGSTNLSKIEQVLGQQKTYDGEYGISVHPDSYDRYGFNSYNADVKRGAVLKVGSPGTELEFAL